MTEEKELYFAEEGFKNWMKQVVEPYLANYRRYSYFKSYDGTSLFYQSYIVEGAKKCVVISHGFCEFAEKYNEMIYYLINNGYSVYIVEHRGHGYSDRETTDTEKVHVTDYQEYVRDFDYFIKRMIGKREKHKILFAHSMGGAIAALYLEQHPGVFEAAILSSPMLCMKTGKYPPLVAKLTASFFVAIGKGDRYAAGQGGFRETPDFAHSSCVSEERYSYVFGKRMKNLQYRTYGSSYCWVRAGLKATTKLMKKKNLAQIKLPVLVFAAGKDHMVDNRAMAVFVNRVATASLFCMEESKHEIFNADYATRRLYYKEVFDFLKHYEITGQNETAGERELAQSHTEQNREEMEKSNERKDEETGKILGTV